MKIIVGNQKNYMTIKEVKNFLDNVILSSNTIICPSNIYLPYFLNRDCKIGLQNVSLDRPITGEVSIRQAISFGIKYIIVGHSERRNLGETNEIINEKIRNLKNIGVILCIGEKENELKKKDKVLKAQILECLKNIDIDNVIIAYEPAWAIGTGRIPINEEINKTVLLIKKIVKEHYGKNIKVLYGGSVNSDNIISLNTIESVDGFLIGKASTDYKEFNEIIKVVK